MPWPRTTWRTFPVDRVAIGWPALGLVACAAVWLCIRSASTAAELAAGAYGRFQFEAAEREHWAFLPVVRPEVPAPTEPSASDGADWGRNPIDILVREEMLSRGVLPAGRAERRVLVRRVFLDLLGLPPTLEEQRAFLQDEAPDAYERLVDRLLARPEYGQRWARHWLDVVRYAETNGYERDGIKPHAWRYRDYVINAFNADKPFDRFLIEQIAGDELPDSTAESQIATTFLRLGPWDDEPADPTVDRYDQLDDVLGTTATTFLGLTLRCARCHDHKFEPLSQLDYARMQAIFEPLTRPQNGRQDLDRLVGTRDELARYEQAIAENDLQVAELQGRIDSEQAALRRQLAEKSAALLSPEAVAAFARPAKERSKEDAKRINDETPQLEEAVLAAADSVGRIRALRSEMEVVKARRPPEPPRAYVWYETGSTFATATHVFRRGDPYQPADTVEPGFPAILVESPPPPPSATEHSTGRRLQLAQWLARSEHPLTARVIVNRVWQHHFGDGLVATENDFGVMGAAPSHPKLLDWLASELVAQGWRLKALQRQILLSETYRLAAQPAADVAQAGEEADPDVSLLWRWRPRRLEAEALRDCVLAVSGQLNATAGGPSVCPPVSQEVLAGQSMPGNGWQVSAAAETTRRSIFVFAKRTLPLPELEVLDLPGSEVPCEQRQVSTVAPQALTLFNGAFMQEQAAHLAQRLESEAGSEPPAQVRLAFEWCLARAPSGEETLRVLNFLEAQEALISREVSAAGAGAPASSEAAAPSNALSPRQRALAAFCLVLLNSNEFAYVE